MSIATIQHVWQANDYHNHSSAQYEAAMQLLKNEQVHFTGSECIFDVGCGDGKITVQIAKCVEKGEVTGIDLSTEMISYAQKTYPKENYPNITFSVQDGQFFESDKPLDVIFSSFALQWFKEPASFFERAAKSLKLQGSLIATIPLNISVELEEVIDTLIRANMWKGYFQDFSPGWHFQTVKKYEELLLKYQFIPRHLSLVHQNIVFPSRTEFENYVIQWFTYLNILPTTLKSIFFKQVIDGYLEKVALLDDGRVSFNFSRIDLIAKKINLLS